MNIGNTVITIHGHKLAVGMAWKALPGISSQAKEVAQLCAEAGVRFGTIVATDDATLVGLHGTTSKIASGAAWVASGSKGEAIVLLEPVGTDSCWVCAVRNSAPQPEFDLVVPNDEVADVLARLARAGNFKTVSKAYDGAAEASDFLDIIDGKKSSQVKQITGIQREVKMLAGLVMVVAVAGFSWVYYSRHKAQVEAQAALAQLSASQAENQKREAEVRRQSEIAAAELAVKLAVSSAPSATGAINAWLGAVENLPTTVAGWSLGKVRCDATACTVGWRRTKLGTTAALLAAAADAGWKVKSSMADAAEVIIPVAIAARAGNPQSIPAEGPAMSELLTALQSMGLAGLEFGLSQAEQPRGAGTPSQPNGAPLSESPWRLGRIALSGKHFFEIRDVPEYLERDHISLSALNFDAESNNWNLEGSYAIK